MRCPKGRAGSNPALGNSTSRATLAPVIQDERTHRRAALLVASALHVALVLALGHWRSPSLWENGAIADALLAGHGFAADAVVPGRLEPTSWQAPAYPLLLAGLWSILGKTPAAHLALSLAQALATASVVLPLAALAARWTRAGAAGAWLAALSPLHAWYATRLHHTALVLALFPWVVWAFVRLRDDDARARHAVAAGLLLGALALVQPVALGVVALLALGWTAAALRARDRARARRLALAGLVALVVLAPWTIRNAVVHGRLVPIKDSFGKELWIGNNPHATGTAYTPGGLVPIDEAHLPPPPPGAREAERFAALGAEARAFIARDPAGFVARTARKVLWLWTWAPADLVRHGHGGEALRLRWLHVTAWLGLVGLALAGARAAGVTREHTAVLAAAFVVTSLVYGLTHVGQARFRGEVEWLLVPLAARGLVIASRARSS